MNKWIDMTGLGNWRCPYCRTDFVFTDKAKIKYRYCPYCGEKIDE